MSSSTTTETAQPYAVAARVPVPLHPTSQCRTTPATTGRDRLGLTVEAKLLTKWLITPWNKHGQQLSNRRRYSAGLRVWWRKAFQSSTRASELDTADDTQERLALRSLEKELRAAVSMTRRPAPYHDCDKQAFANFIGTLCGTTY